MFGEKKGTSHYNFSGGINYPQLVSKTFSCFINIFKWLQQASRNAVLVINKISSLSLFISQTNISYYRT